MTSWQDKLALTAQRNRQEIVKAKLSKREMMRLGLLTAGGALVAKAGLSSRAGFAAETLTDPDATLSRVPGSPPVRPWIAPMPRLTVKTPVDPYKMTAGKPLVDASGNVMLGPTGKPTYQAVPPDGYTPVDGATMQVPHQFFKKNPDGTYTDKFGKTKFYQLDTVETPIKLHPDYSPTKFFGFDGLVPGPLFREHYGTPTMVRFNNQLPSVNIPQPFAITEMTTHLHNGHTPSESDGNPVNYFNSCYDPNAANPLGYKDQHYPNVYAGYTARGDLVGNPNEALASLWYHDHHLDYTAQNVYKGMFGCYNLFDSLDTGVPGTGLKLPCGPSANGDDLDCPIFFHDPLLDSHCQLVFDLFNLDGILGDRFAANGAIQPFLNVAKQRYRFRLYAPGPSRWWEWSLWNGTSFEPFWQIATDGNLLPNAVKVTSCRIAVAERVDIIVDFAEIFKRTGKTRLYFVNRAEQVNGRGPTGKTLTPGTPCLQVNMLGNVVTNDPSADPSVAPAGSPPGVGMKLRDLPDTDFAALQAKAATLPVRTWRFERGSGGWMVNGKFFDENVVDAAIPQGSEEVWVIQNPGGSWRHPVHIHFEEHRMLSRNGVAVKPATQLNGAIDYSRRDVINLQTNDEVRLFMRFRDMGGSRLSDATVPNATRINNAYNRYVMHCHNVVHEDHAMMIRWDIT